MLGHFGCFCVFFVYVGTFFLAFRVFWWNFVMFDGLLGNLGIFWDILLWICMDLVAFVLIFDGLF